MMVERDKEEEEARNVEEGGRGSIEEGRRMYGRTWAVRERGGEVGNVEKGRCS